MPSSMFDIASSDVHDKIRHLIAKLTTISDDSGEFVFTLPSDGSTKIDTKSWCPPQGGWDWTQGIGLYGIWKYYELTGAEEFLKIIEDWFEVQLTVGHKGKNINTVAVFLTLAYVYERTGNRKYVPWLDAWAEWAYHDLPRTRRGGMEHMTYLSRNEQELWDDTLMMTVMPLAKIGLVLDRPHYVEEAKKQFLIHIQYLWDSSSGLFFHGWTFQDGGHNFARARWARGNAWVTIVIPEFIELVGLDRDDFFRAHLLNTLHAQCEALAPLQSPSGLWRTLLDVPEDEGSYLEASATAGFAYGMLKAERRKYLAPEFQEVAVKAIKGVLSNIDADGELLQTSFGTGMGHDLQHYKDIPRTSMPYGQAMAMMALVEFLRVFY